MGIPDPTARFARWASVCLLCLASLLGCEARGPQRFPVAGRVLFKGEPLEHGSIQFLTTSGPPGPAAGALIKAGRYEIPKAQGLEPGAYRVIISSTVEVKKLPPGWTGSPPTEEHIPPAYSSATKGTITIEVTPEGSHEFNYSID